MVGRGSDHQTTDDPKVHYITTTINPERTREEISEILRAYENLETKSSNWSVPPLWAEIYHLFEPRPFLLKHKVASKI